MGTRKVFLLVFLVILQGIIPQSLGQAPQSADVQNSRVILKALFGGDLPCATGDCSDYEATESSSKYPEVVYTEGYEPQSHLEPEEAVYDPVYPDAGSEELSQEEELVEVDLCSNLVETIEALESENPDLAPVKVKVLDDLIEYASAFGQAQEGEGCDPAIQLLDIILAAAQKLKEDYQSASDYQCQSTDTYVEYTTEAPEEQGYEETKEEYEHSTMQPYPPFPEGTEASTEYHFEEVTEDEPCPESSTARYEPPVEKPCDEEEEVIAEVDEAYHHPSPHFVGSVRGVPGEHFPNYTEIPITSFSCADKCIPGFYADLETGCQVFHVCYEHRRESFLCPVGTIFNQPIMACDFWYSSNCSLAPTYYDVNCKTEEYTRTEVDTAVVTSIEADKVEHQVPEELPEVSEETLDELSQFLPVKAKVTVFSKTDEQAQSEDVEEVADQIFNKIITTATHTVSKTRDVIAKLPEPVETEVKVQFKKPVPAFRPKFLKVKVLPKSKVTGKVLAVKAAVPVAKFVVAKSALPVVAKAKMVAGKVIAAKAAVPVIAKAKVVAGKAIAAKAAVPVIAKAKVAAAAVPVAKLAAGKAIAAKVAVPVAFKTKAVVAAKVAAPAAAAVMAKKVVPAKAVAAKTVVVKAAAVKGPALKTKILAASLPFGKAAMLKASVPIATAKLAPVLKVKGKMMALPLAKGKALAVAPLVKAKVVKAAMISPITKKALALGYMKLLKAKKLALIG